MIEPLGTGSTTLVLDDHRPLVFSARKGTQSKGIPCVSQIGCKGGLRYGGIVSHEDRNGEQILGPVRIHHIYDEIHKGCRHDGPLFRRYFDIMGIGESPIIWLLVLEGGFQKGRAPGHQELIGIVCISWQSLLRRGVVQLPQLSRARWTRYWKVRGVYQQFARRSILNHFGRPISRDTQHATAFIVAHNLRAAKHNRSHNGISVGLLCKREKEAM